MSELTLQEAVLAWAQGKRVEALLGGSGRWTPVDPVGQCVGDCYSPSVFSCHEYIFRLAPEPPQKRYRPWIPEEVPVGAVIRKKSMNLASALIGAHGESTVFVVGLTNPITFEDALENWLHSVDPLGTPDDKRTWLPCGVEVIE